MAKGTASYTYNGFGSRVGVKSPTESIRYVLDLTRDYNNLLARSVNGSGEDFIYDSGLLSMTGKGEDYFYLLDELGSPVYMTGEDAAVHGTYAYDEFGGRKNYGESLGNVNQPFTFTGYQEDEYSGSYFAQARYYLPGVGRFAGEDQVKGLLTSPKSQNRYAYCFGNPMELTDRNGKWPTRTEFLADLRDIWNKYVHSEKVVESQELRCDVYGDYVGGYYVVTEDEVAKSDVYTGKIIEKTISTKRSSDGDTISSVGYSINIPSLELWNGYTIGPNSSLGVNFGSDISFGLSASAGYTIGDIGVNIPAEITIGGEDFLPSASASAEFSFNDKTYAIDASVDTAVLGSIKFGTRTASTEDVTDLTSITTQVAAGIFAKTGLVYAVALVAYGVYATTQGQPVSIWVDKLSVYMQDVSQSCPFR